MECLLMVVFISVKMVRQEQLFTRLVPVHGRLRGYKMSTVSIPPQVLNGPITINAPTIPSASVPTVTITQPNIAGAIGLLCKGANVLGQIIEANDFFTNPIWSSSNAGGASNSFGDRMNAFYGTDIFNPMFQTMTATADNMSTNAGGLLLGHGTGIVRLFCGTGVPGAAYPVTTGIPANGSIYFRLDGGAGT